MVKPVFLFVIGLVCLIKGGDWFVDGSIGIARKFHLPEILIGATVVSIGTTLPEVMVSVSAAVTGHGEIAYGNAIGSIICNTALIAATTLIFAPGRVNKLALKTPVLFFFISAVFYTFIACYFHYFSRISGFILLGIFIIYMIETIKQMSEDSMNQENSSDGELKQETPSYLRRYIALLIIGAALIAVGARLLVDNGTLIAQFLGVPESVIALTFVALGTSLPELVTAITSLIKGHGALSVGNIIGANIFNLVLVSGLSISIAPFTLPEASTLFGYNASLVLDLPVMFLVMIILTIPTLLNGKLTRIQGIVLWIIYFTYCIIQFMM